MSPVHVNPNWFLNTTDNPQMLCLVGTQDGKDVLVYIPRCIVDQYVIERVQKLVTDQMIAAKLATQTPS